MDYELINEINDNDAREIEELKEEYENEERAKEEFIEGCYLDNARGRFIPYNVILIAIDYGYTPSDEFTRLQKEAIYLEKDEEEFITDYYEWLYEEMDRAENYMNDKYAKEGYYFGIMPDWGDWGYYKFEEED